MLDLLNHCTAPLARGGRACGLGAAGGGHAYGLGAAGGGRACGGPGQQQLGRGRCGLAWGGAAAEIGRRWRRRRWGSAGGVVNGKDVCEDFFFFLQKQATGGCFVGL